MIKRRTVLADLLARPVLHDADVACVEASRDRQTRTVKTTIQQTLYLPPGVHDQLRTLAFHRRVSMHAIVMEGLDKVFQENGLKSISELSQPK